jgi:hypothetical protein
MYTVQYTVKKIYASVSYICKKVFFISNVNGTAAEIKTVEKTRSEKKWRASCDFYPLEMTRRRQEGGGRGHCPYVWACRCVFT